MSEEDGDLRVRDDKPNEYRIDAVVKGCSIVCSVPGVKLVDFYRSPGLLCKECGK